MAEVLLFDAIYSFLLSSKLQPSMKSSKSNLYVAAKSDINSPESESGIFNLANFGGFDSVEETTATFQKAGNTINEAGGGTLVIPAGTYTVGGQRFAGSAGKGYAYQPSPVLAISGCKKPVVIEGNGTTLRFADGLRFGSFDPITGKSYSPTLPFTDYNYTAGCGSMLDLNNNASVTVKNLTLDGNIDSIELGGFWGDTGRQVSGSGIRAYGNSSLTIEKVNAHHFPLDGIMIDGDNTTLIDITSQYNARQGLSWVGGNGLKAIRCKFNHTGKGRFSSAPGAGVDIEQEGAFIRNGLFEECEFINNTGCGMVADSGNSANCRFKNCLFYGSTSWSIWPRKPGFVFEGCAITGCAVNAHEGTIFKGCLFTDAPLNGWPVYGDYLIDARVTDLINCDLAAIHGKRIGWTLGTRFTDCCFDQFGNTGTAYVRGEFYGHNDFQLETGANDFYGSRFHGKTTVRGRVLSIKVINGEIPPSPPRSTLPPL